MSSQFRGVITTGRTLLSCSQEQFKQFLPPYNVYPQTGHLRIALKSFEFTCALVDWSWQVTNPDGSNFCSEHNERAALRRWWVKVGRELVIQHREDVRAWETMPRQGRPAADPEDPEAADTSMRVMVRDAAWTRMSELWLELREVMTSHHAQCELWMDQANDRAVPRPHSTRKVGARKTLRHALHQLLDVDRRNQPIHDSIWRETRPDDELAGALAAEFMEVGGRGDAAGLHARMAMQLGLTHTQQEASAYFGDIRRVLHIHEIETPEDLRELTRRATN